MVRKLSALLFFFRCVFVMMLLIVNYLIHFFSSFSFDVKGYANAHTPDPPFAIRPTYSESGAAEAEGDWDLKRCLMVSN